MGATLAVPADEYRSPIKLMQNALVFTFLLCVPMLSGCDAPGRSVPAYDLVEGPCSSWSMSPDDVVLTATEYCDRKNINLSAYSVPRMTCDSLDGERFWSILYDGLTRTPGDHFMLLLNDETGVVEYIPGE